LQTKSAKAGDTEIPYTFVFVNLTAVDLQNGLLIYYNELIGKGISYADTEIEGIYKKAEDKVKEIKKFLEKDKFGFKVKDGVYEE
jgi:hypothetical protein